MKTATAETAPSDAPRTGADPSGVRALLGENGWTGGQYSLFRLIFGSYLLVHFAHLAAWGAEIYSDRGVLPEAGASPLIWLFPNVLGLYDAAWFVTTLLIIAAGLAGLLAVGWRDRLAAVALWYLWACFLGRNPLTLNPGLPYVGLMLLAHALLPPAPYGSLAARGRTDPGGEWFMPQSVWAVVWVLMALGYSYSGYTKLVSPSWLDGSALRHVLENPLARPTPLRDLLLALPSPLLRLMTWAALALELCFAPLALFRRLRPWLWIAALLMHLGLMALVDFADLSVGMVMLHLFTFNPAWVKPQPSAGAATLYYDGHCGLCHRLVRFSLAEDRHQAFRFAPLQEADLTSTSAQESGAASADSVLVIADDNRRPLTRSAAVLYVLGRLGGVWRVLATIGRVAPRKLLDSMYNALASHRHQLFRRPPSLCPVIPARFRSRFSGSLKQPQ